jgi:putative transposase
MTPPANPERYKHHRFPGEMISHGVWLYDRFHLSYRDGQELLFERGVTVSHEAIRQWCQNLGRTTPIGCVGVALSLGTNGT